MRSSYLRNFALVLGFVFCVIILPGCPSSTNPDDNTDPAEDISKAEKVKRCERRLDDVVALLQPRDLGINTDNKIAIHSLNQWVEECANLNDESSQLSEKTKTSLPDYFKPDEIKQLLATRFNSRDGLHVRDCYLYKEMGESVADNEKSDLKQAVELFYFVTRLIELDANLGSPLPMRPQEVLLAGRGSAKDRAVIFCGILQQLRIETILIQPGGSIPDKSSKKADAWLIGVLINGKVYLFDMQLGIPVPAINDTKDILPQHPATLAEVLKNDQIFRQLDASDGEPYPLKSEDLKSLQIKVVHNHRCFSAANFLLQNSLLGDNAVIIYDSLTDNSGGDGIISRVMNFADDRWKQDDISIWNYSEDQYKRLDNLSQTERQQRQFRLGPLSAPISIVFGTKTIGNKKAKEKDGKPVNQPKMLYIVSMNETGMMKQFRIAQILGEPGIAIRGFQQMRLKIRHNIGLTLQTIQDAKDLKVEPTARAEIPTALNKNQLALYFASFWSSACQIDQQEYQSSINNLIPYFVRNAKNKDYILDPNSPYDNHAQFLLAVSYAHVGKFASASQILKSFPKQSPIWRECQFLVKRWRKIKAQSTKTDPPKKAEPKKTPKPKPKETKKTPVKKETKKKEKSTEN